MTIRRIWFTHRRCDGRGCRRLARFEALDPSGRVEWRLCEPHNRARLAGAALLLASAWAAKVGRS